jgi:bacterioferritin
LIEHLNEDLAGELQAIGMYIQYSALLRGAHRKELRDLFQAEIPDEQRHAQLLADKIAVLEGTPTTTPRPVPVATNPLQMLNNIFKAEGQAVADYTDRAQEAEAAGEIGLKVELESVVVDETRHKEEVKQILSGWNEPGFDVHE